MRDSLHGARRCSGHAELRRLLLLGWLAPMFAVAPEALAAPYVSHHGGRRRSSAGGWSRFPLGTIAGDVAGVRLLTRAQQRRLVAPAAAAGFVPYLAFVVDPSISARTRAARRVGACGLYALGLDGASATRHRPAVRARDDAQLRRADDPAGPRLRPRRRRRAGCRPAYPIAIAGGCGIVATVVLMGRELSRTEARHQQPRRRSSGTSRAGRSCSRRRCSGSGRLTWRPLPDRRTDSSARGGQPTAAADGPSAREPRAAARAGARSPVEHTDRLADDFLPRHAERGEALVGVELGEVCVSRAPRRGSSTPSSRASPSSSAPPHSGGASGAACVLRAPRLRSSRRRSAPSRCSTPPRVTRWLRSAPGSPSSSGPRSSRGLAAARLRGRPRRGVRAASGPPRDARAPVRGRRRRPSPSRGRGGTRAPGRASTRSRGSRCAAAAAPPSGRRAAGFAEPRAGDAPPRTASGRSRPPGTRAGRRRPRPRRGRPSRFGVRERIGARHHADLCSFVVDDAQRRAGSLRSRVRSPSAEGEHSSCDVLFSLASFRECDRAAPAPSRSVDVSVRWAR